MSIYGYIAKIATYLGKNDEAVPTDDTAPSGLNGRFQRVAQNLSALLTKSNDANDKLEATKLAVEESKVVLEQIKLSIDQSNTTLQALNTQLANSNVLLNAIKTAVENP